MSSAIQIPELTSEEEKLMQSELNRLNNITKTIWQEGQRTGWESMSHTVNGARRYEIKGRSTTIQKNMASIMKISSRHNIKNKSSTNYAVIGSTNINFKKFLSL